MAILNFNAQTVDPNSSFDPLPPGWYNARMIESEIKPTKAGDGAMLACQYEIIDGQYNGRRVFANYNIENKNPVAVKIAYEQLSALGYVTGVIDMQDSEMLHGIPIQIKLSLREASGGYDASNDIKGYRDQHGRDPKDIIAGGAGGPAAPGAPAAPNAAPAAPAAPKAPAAPAAPKAPAAPAAPTHDPIAAAVADGWAAHPETDGYYWKGEAVITGAELAEQYPAPEAAPAAPAAPKAPAAPAAPAAGGKSPPWVKPAA